MSSLGNDMTVGMLVAYDICQAVISYCEYSGEYRAIIIQTSRVL